jgi:hypothetical protein
MRESIRAEPAVRIFRSPDIDRQRCREPVDQEDQSVRRIALR